MLIRQATAQDSSFLKDLLSQLGYELTLAQIQNRLEAYHHKNYGVFIAEESGKILGFITFVIYDCFVFEGKCMHIESMVVDENHRGQGIGKKLMKWAEEEAQKNQCKVIELTSFNHRKADGTHAFYENLEYQDNIKADLTYFTKAI